MEIAVGIHFKTCYIFLQSCFLYFNNYQVDAALAPLSGEKMPVNSFQRSQDLLVEILHRFQSRLVVDLSAQDGSWGAAALSRGTPYMGVCFNMTHVMSSSQLIKQTNVV